MENSVNVRISKLIATLKMSNNAFAKSLAKTSTTINQIVAGRNKPGFEVLDAICEVFNVNPSWLMRGEGEMFIKVEDKSETSAAPDQYLQDQVKQLEESFNRLATQLEVKDKQIESKDRQIEKLMDLLGKHEDVALYETSRIKPMWSEFLLTKQG